MDAGNQMKRSFVVDQHAEDEAQVVRLIQEVAFCVGSQQKQAAPQPVGNVLDDLTLSDQQELSAFSLSLIRSASNRAHNHHSLNSSKDSLTGPPHKKFSKDSKSSSLSRNGSLIKGGSLIKSSSLIKSDSLIKGGSLSKRTPPHSSSRSNPTQDI